MAWRSISGMTQLGEGSMQCTVESNSYTPAEAKEAVKRAVYDMACKGCIQNSTVDTLSGFDDRI